MAKRAARKQVTRTFSFAEWGQIVDFWRTRNGAACVCLTMASAMSSFMTVEGVVLERVRLYDDTDGERGWADTAAAALGITDRAETYMAERSRREAAQNAGRSESDWF